MGAFALPAWAVYATEVFDKFAPASWVFAGIIGVVVSIFGYWLWCWAKTLQINSRLRAKTLDSQNINPLDSIFHGKRIRVSDLAPPVGGIIENKAFVDCEIVGPATIMWENCTNHECTGSVVDGIVVAIGAQARNGFGFRNCAFTKCRFYLLTVLIPAEQHLNFIGPRWGGINWISYFPPLNQTQAAATDTQSQPSTEPETPR